jgi:hypothetical protein
LHRRQILTVRWVRALEVPKPIESEGLTIYASNPRQALCDDGRRYVLKGPSLAQIVAEYMGYTLAKRVELPVPEFALCRANVSSEVLFASRMSDRALRFPADSMLRADKSGIGLLADCAVFDIWVANEDRNPGNIIGEPIGGYGNPSISYLLIDFERSLLLSGTSGLEVNMFSPSKFMPKPALKDLLPRPPIRSALLDQIAGVTSAEVLGHFTDLENALGERISWRDSATHHLMSRATKLTTLVREAYND